MLTKPVESQFSEVETICRQMANDQVIPNLVELKQQLQKIPVNVSTASNWHKCLLLIKKLNQKRLRHVRLIFIKNLRKIDINDKELVSVICKLFKNDCKIQKIIHCLSFSN